jgi:hypothetical protein
MLTGTRGAAKHPRQPHNIPLEPIFIPKLQI